MATQLTGVNVGEVMGALERLVVRERAISRRRRELHERIDRLYLASPLGEADLARLDRLEELEREVSRQRHRLHREIDVLRSRLGLAPWRADRGLDDAA